MRRGKRVRKGNIWLSVGYSHPVREVPASEWKADRTETGLRNLSQGLSNWRHTSLMRVSQNMFNTSLFFHKCANLVRKKNMVACRDVAMQRPRDRQIYQSFFGKHIPAATYTNATTEELLETVFSTRSVPRCNFENFRSQLIVRRWRGD
jgi:hypothetical protein